jgi:hypothetical protein
MERLFSPCTRLHGLLQSQGRLPELRYFEDLFRELNLDVSTEELLGAERAFTYADLYAMLKNGNTLAWLNPHAAVTGEDGSGFFCTYYLQDYYRFRLNVDGKDMVALASSSAVLSETFDVVRRLLLADVSEVYELTFTNVGQSYEVFFNAFSFANLVEQCDNLKTLTLEQIASLDEDHFRALGAISRPGLEIELKHCRITGAAAAVLAQVLGRNQGPTKLDACEIDNLVLANGLRGNSRLKSLRLRTLSSPDQELLAIADALRENKGLANLDLRHGFTMSDESWNAVCDSLNTHPTLKVLNLYTDEGGLLAPAVLKSRIQALVDMLKVNMSMHIIDLGARYSKHELFRGSVIPYLDTNRFRSRVRAIQKTRPIPYRAKVLGRALLAARTDSNRFWMLFSGNVEVASPPTTATTPAAANLPTAVTDAVTSNTAAVATSVAVTGYRYSDCFYNWCLCCC